MKGLIGGLAQGVSGNKNANLGSIVGQAIGRGIARRRARRAAAGPRGPRGRAAPRRRRARAGRRQGRASVRSYAAPAQVGGTQVASIATSQTIRRTEVATDVVGHVNFTKSALALIPSDDVAFPSLSAASSQYQRFRFREINLRYVPSVGTSAKGEIAFAACTGVKIGDDVTTWDEIMSLPNAQSVTVWTANDARFRAANFNQQFDKGWTITFPCNEVDMYDPTQCQGVVLYAVRGCDVANEGVRIGTIAVTYSCELMVPRKKVCVAPQFESQVSATTNADFATDTIMDHDNSWFKVDGDAATGYIVTYRSRDPFFVAFVGTSLTNTTPTIVSTDCTVVRVKDLSSSSATKMWVLAHCLPNVSQGLLQINCAGATAYWCSAWKCDMRSLPLELVL